MSLDLQKVALRRLLDTGDHDFYTRLVYKYFTGANLMVFTKVQLFYKANLRLPSIDEFISLRKDDSLQEYFESQILKEENANLSIRNEFLLGQLQDFCIREETLDFLTKLLEEFEYLEKVEILDKFQNHLLELNKSIPVNEELFDVADLDIFPSSETFKMHSSGLSTEYDAHNGGFGQSELVMIGGRRGSGKSILALNCAYRRFDEGHTVAFFSVEMRYKEVYDRLMSLISGVKFLDILLGRASNEDKIKIAESKINTFYDIDSKEVTSIINELKKTNNFKGFDKYFREKKYPFKKHRFFLIDDAGLTINRTDHFCNMFSSKYPNFTMGVVDYINIIREKNNKDWQVQIDMAESLKFISRKYDLTMLAPYQIDATGEARFAKGILDSADRAFTFMPPDEATPNMLKIFTSKIRNGKQMTFDVPMNWECVHVMDALTMPAPQKLTRVEQFGNEGEPAGDRPKEQARELN